MARVLEYSYTYIFLYIYIWFVDTWSLISVKTPRHGICSDMSLVLDFYAYMAIYTFSFDENPPTNMGYTPICRGSLTTPMRISLTIYTYVIYMYIYIYIYIYIWYAIWWKPPTNMGFHGWYECVYICIYTHLMCWYEIPFLGMITHMLDIFCLIARHSLRIRSIWVYIYIYPWIYICVYYGYIYRYIYMDAVADWNTILAWYRWYSTCRGLSPDCWYSTRLLDASWQPLVPCPPLSKLTTCAVLRSRSRPYRYAPLCAVHSRGSIPSILFSRPFSVHSTFYIFRPYYIPFYIHALARRTPQPQIDCSMRATTCENPPTHSTTPNRLLDARYDLRKSPDQYGIYPNMSLVREKIIHFYAYIAIYTYSVWWYDVIPTFCGESSTVGVYIYIYIYTSGVLICVGTPFYVGNLQPHTCIFIYIYIWFVDTWSPLSAKIPRPIWDIS